MWKYFAPPVTLALVVSTVTTYVIGFSTGQDFVARALGLIPSRVSMLSTIGAAGDGQALPAWLTLVTYMFLHRAWLHVTTNMVGLWAFGRFAEPIMGSWRFLITYLASGVFTGLLIVFLVPGRAAPAGGASGAICGTLGAFMALRLREWPGRDRRHLPILATEIGCGVGVLCWLFLRSPISVPNRMTALMWHLIPFLGGWACVRMASSLGAIKARALLAEPVSSENTRVS